MPRNSRVLQKRTRIVAAIAILLGFLVLFAGIVTFYIIKFDKELAIENQNHLSEVASYVAAHMTSVVEDTQEALKAVATAISAMDSEQTKMDYLMKISQQYDFAYMGYADSGGQLHATESKQSVDVSNETYFQNALKGQVTVSNLTRKFLSDHAASGILLAVPMGDDHPTGMLIAMMEISKLSDVLSLESFGGDGYSYVFDKNGTIIMRTKSIEISNVFDTWKTMEFEDGYSYQKLYDEIMADKEGITCYNNWGVKLYAYHHPLPFNSWSLVNVVSAKSVSDGADQLTRQLVLIGGAIVLTFLILMLLAMRYYSISQNSKQEANAKSAFLANMSHEIRTPMNAIVGISEILLREEITQTQKNYVLSIINSGNGLLTIINDILDVSKMESGKFSIIDEEYEFQSLIYDVITISSIKIGEKPIELLVDINPDVSRYMIGDMTRVKQVLLNIVGNAVKFTQSGYIKISVGQKTASEVTTLVITVEDTGIGIKKEDLDKLFISFNQVDTHKNRGVEGTGLGLVISKRLCEMMGGCITVESEYTKGSTFNIEIMQAITKPDKLIDTSDMKNFSVLLLEEDPVLREHFATCLSKMKLNYEVCENYDSFAENLEVTSYTHALAKPKLIQRLSDEGRAITNVCLVSLLALHEQSTSEDSHLSVVAPLFALQLSSVLHNRKGQMPQMKRSGIDTTAIHPLPFARVLLVDDNEVNLQVARGLMIPYHMQVDCALSGQKALSMIESNQYDLIFMDHMMPEMDGVETVEIIRRLPEETKRSIPVVALTANITNDAHELFMDAGFNDFLAKPIETVKLNEILKKWLRDKNDKREEENPEEAAKFNREFSKEKDHTVEKPLSKTAYVDFEAGMKMIKDIDVYCDILTTYCGSAKEKLVMLPMLLEREPHNFTIEIHGLKGASGGIFASIVAKKALELEELSKEKKIEDIHQKLPEFLVDLKTTIDCIEIFMSEHESLKAQAMPPIHGKERIEGKLPKERLLAMRESLLDFDTDSVKLILDEFRQVIHDDEETTLLSAIETCCKNYDFDLAIELIEKYDSTQ